MEFSFHSKLALWSCVLKIASFVCVSSELWVCARVNIQNSTKLMNNVHC